MERQADMATREPCPVCHGYGVTGRNYLMDGYRVDECVCGHWYLSNRPTEAEMFALYASDEYFAGCEEGGYSSYAAQEDALRRTFRRLLSEMDKRGMRGGRLLEIGCGYGYFLDEARRYFDELVGTDFSRDAVEQAGRVETATVHLGGIEQVREEPVHDVAVAIEVLEHVYRPVWFLSELRKRLKPGGSVVIVVPNAGSVLRRLMGTSWPSWKLPEHISHFTASSLARALKRAGFVRPSRIPLAHAYPAGLVLEKLGVSRCPAWLARRPVWLPGVVMAMEATKPVTGAKGKIWGLAATATVHY